MAHPLKGILRKLNIGIYEFEVSVIRWSWFVGFFDAFAKWKGLQSKHRGFYNLENLFDYEDDPLTFDDDRTPDGKDHWTKEIYEAKLKNMAQVISEIERMLPELRPQLLGFVKSKTEGFWKIWSIKKHFGQGLRNRTVRFPRQAGYWCGLTLSEKYLPPPIIRLLNWKFTKTMILPNVFTQRDQLLVGGMLDGEKIILL